MDAKTKFASILLAVAEVPSTAPVPPMSPAQQARWDALLKKAKSMK